MTTQVCHVTLTVDYPGVGQTIGRDALAGLPVQSLRPTISANVANVWSQIAKIAPGTLQPGKYAVVSVNIHGATSKAFRLRHADFNGLCPGGAIGNTVGHKKNFFSFAEFDSCPVFDAASDLMIDTLATGTDTGVVSIMVAKLS